MFKAVLALPKTARSAQTHKSITFIWIVWSTLYWSKKSLPKGTGVLGSFLSLAPKWKDHKIRLVLVFHPYLRMSLPERSRPLTVVHNRAKPWSWNIWCIHEHLGQEVWTKYSKTELVLMILWHFSDMEGVVKRVLYHYLFFWKDPLQFEFHNIVPFHVLLHHFNWANTSSPAQNPPKNSK